VASIGLDLEPMVFGNVDDDFSREPTGRDLVTPPVMGQAQCPPPLSPRFGFASKNDSPHFDGYHPDPPTGSPSSRFFVSTTRSNDSTKQAIFSMDCHSTHH
jgi:hypothetical protein